MKKIFILLLTGTLLAGCAVIDDSKKEQTLEKATLFYEKAIRWGDFSTARQFQHKDADSPQTPADLEKVKVTSYRQLDVRPRADDNEVMVIVQIDYYNDDAMKIHTIRDEQVWRYEPEASEWRLTSPLPAFR